MASDGKINKITIWDSDNQQSKTYDIDLPSTATPSITGLTTQTLAVGGDATISGTLSTTSLLVLSSFAVLNKTVLNSLDAWRATISSDLTVKGKTTISGSISATSAEISGSPDDGYILICPTSSTSDPTIVFYDHPNDVETTLTQSIQSRQFELQTNGKFLFQENTQKFQFPATGGTLVTKEDIDLINERLDNLGFKGGSAVVTEDNGGQPIVTVNSLTKQGKYVLFTLSWTVEELSFGTVRNTTVSIAEPFRPKSEVLPNFIITFSCAGGYVGTTYPRWSEDGTNFGVSLISTLPTMTGNTTFNIQSVGWETN